MSTPGATWRGALARDRHMFGAAFVYELRKVTTWRVGFLMREVLRGTWRPLVMIFVYAAIARTSGSDVIGTWTYPELVHYLILAAAFEKLLFHQRGLDVADQIFEGYVTKYLVMPLRFFMLPLARFAQHIVVQVCVVGAMWTVGVLAIPRHWPHAASDAALWEALALVLLGSYCWFLTCFIVNELAFWLEVIWTLSAMASFVLGFMSGVLVPVSLMPGPLRAALTWLYPYWAVSAPVEIFLGRLSHDAFARGVCVLLATILALELVRQTLWRRGLSRYTGGGM
jgi:ABC-2 type transport system permease protein